MGIITSVSAIFRARLHIGYIAFPYAVLGFFLHWSIYNFDLNYLLENDPNSLIRVLLAILIAFIYMPYLFIINDYFDSEDDKLDPKKSLRNPFCNDSFKKNPLVKFLIFSPLIIVFVIGFWISYWAGITTILALVLGTFYSAPPFRFKEQKFSDFIVHGFCLGIYFFSLGFYAIWITPNPYIIPAFWLVMYLSFTDAAWIHLDSALVDYYVDKKGGVNTTVVSLGPNKALIILFLMLLTILCIPSLYFLTNNVIITKMPEISYLFAAIFLILPISYVIAFFKNKDNFETARTISSRYRVYIMYSVTFMAVLLTNDIIFT
jgi:4-hydroxybenzoate polyprenyltransferase